MRVAFGSFSHETNCFSAGMTDLAQFTVLRGREMADSVRSTRAGVAGFLEEGEARGWEMLPLLSAGATPWGPVARNAFDHVVEQIILVIESSAPLDALLLSLHGAMIVEGRTDGEGELLARLREVVGGDLPILCTLDHHAQVTQAMVEHATALFPFDTNPHVDGKERAIEAAQCLARIAAGEWKPVVALGKPPMLPPTLRMLTAAGPLAETLALAFEWERDPRVINVGVCGGFPTGDFVDAGSSIIAITNDDPALAREIADSLAGDLYSRREAFRFSIPGAEEAVARALAAPRGPVVLADVSDNPGGGGSGETTALLAELLKQKAERAALAQIYDPAAVERCIDAGVGARFALTLGGWLDTRWSRPLEVEGTVRAITDGRFHPSGPMGRGSQADYGRMVRFDSGGVSVLLASKRKQTLDPAIFLSMGIDPMGCSVLAVKSRGHFRAAFTPIAAEIIEVLCPGAASPDLSNFKYEYVRRPIWPLDETG